MSFPTNKTTGFFTLLLCWLLTSTGCTSTSNKEPQKAQSSGAADVWRQADDLLHQRLQDVLDADNAYAELASQAVATGALDARNEAIAQAELALLRTMDSLDQSVGETGNVSGLQQTIGHFRKILQSRGTLSDLRMVLSANSDDSTTMQHTLLQLRNELREKDKQITALERNNSRQQEAGTQRPNETEPKANAPAKGENLADLRQQNKNLSTAYNELQNKYFLVGRNYLLLKQEHERTMNELATLRKGKQ
jgi:hypothetical protein